MSPGVYYIDNQLSIQNGSTLIANGVTIVINGSFYIGAGSTLNITAPTTGPSAGIAIFGNGPSGTQEFLPNSQIIIQGALYFPHQTIQFDPNSQLISSLCTQIIADQIVIENNAYVSDSCSGTGVKSIPILQVYLSS